MSKHLNKHWIREKEFISLNLELDFLYDSNIGPHGFRFRVSNSRISEIDNKLIAKFYNEYHGRYRTPPKHYKRLLNKRLRAKSKMTLFKLINISDNYVFEDRPDGSWW
jgi:hypothetical protein